MSDNLRHWSVLGKTDPKHTKPFSRAGGFKGTATRPIWTEYRLTEHFGPCGIGWGCDEPQFTLVPAGDEILIFCTLRCWYAEDGKQASLYGVGGDKVYTKNKNGPYTDDEAYKKAFTDAMGNAFKHVGSGADVHMGMFEDSKYLAAVRQEFAEDAAPPSRPAPQREPTPFDDPMPTTMRHPSPVEPGAVTAERQQIIAEWWSRDDYGLNPDVIDGGLPLWDTWFARLVKAAPTLDAFLKLKADNELFYKRWYKSVAAPVSGSLRATLAEVEAQLAAREGKAA